MALGVIEGKDAIKNRIFGHILFFFREGIQYFYSIIIHLGLLINRQVGNNHVFIYSSSFDQK